MAGFEISNGLRVPFNAGLIAGRTAIGLTSRMLEPAANRLMLPAGQTEFVHRLAIDHQLSRIEAAAGLFTTADGKHERGLADYSKVARLILEAEESSEIPEKAVVEDIVGVAADIGLNPKQIQLSEERQQKAGELEATAPLSEADVSQITELMQKHKKVKWMPQER
jgi:hypothetical protein